MIQMVGFMVLKRRAGAELWCHRCSACMRSPGVNQGLPAGQRREDGLWRRRTGGWMMTSSDYPRLLCRCAPRFLGSSCVCGQKQLAADSFLLQSPFTMAAPSSSSSSSSSSYVNECEAEHDRESRGRPF